MSKTKKEKKKATLNKHQQSMVREIAGTVVDMIDSLEYLGARTLDIAETGRLLNSDFSNAQALVRESRELMKTFESLKESKEYYGNK